MEDANNLVKKVLPLKFNLAKAKLAGVDAASTRETHATVTITLFKNTDENLPRSQAFTYIERVIFCGKPKGFWNSSFRVLKAFRIIQING